LFAAPHWYDMITRVVVMILNCNQNVNSTSKHASFSNQGCTEYLILVKRPNTNDAYAHAGPPARTYTQKFPVWIKRHFLQRKFAIERASHSNDNVGNYCLQQT
jgi:hypothetical protein